MLADDSFYKGSFRGNRKSEDIHNKPKLTKGCETPIKDGFWIFQQMMSFFPKWVFFYGAVNESNPPILMVSNNVPHQHESCFLYKRDLFPLRVNKTKQQKFQCVHFPHCFHTNPLFEKTKTAQVSQQVVTFSTGVFCESQKENDNLQNSKAQKPTKGTEQVSLLTNVNIVCW